MRLIQKYDRGDSFYKLTVIKVTDREDPRKTWVVLGPYIDFMGEDFYTWEHAMAFVKGRLGKWRLS